jgi:beta-glucosidase
MRRALAFVSLGALGALALPQAGSAATGGPPLPAGSIWGVSSSGFQSEGHTTDSNWDYYIRRDAGAHPVGSATQPYGNSVDFYDR